jgi:hypothetical protein
MELLNTHEKWFGNLGRSLDYTEEQTFWDLKGFVLKGTPVRRGSCWHSADSIVSSLQLLGCPLEVEPGLHPSC